MTEKIYYVIQDKKGEFFTPDNLSGGYPYFTDDFEFCERYNSEDSAITF